MKSELTNPDRNLPVAIKPANSKDLSQEMSEWTDRIAKRAYELFQLNGFNNGHNLDDWFAAEHELLKPVAVEVKDNKDEFIVRAEVPGFEAKDLEIDMDGNTLVIKGKHVTTREEKEKEGKTIYSERTAEQIYRMLELAVPVLADRAQAQIKNGVLELKLPKASRPKSTMVTAA